MAKKVNKKIAAKMVEEAVGCVREPFVEIAFGEGDNEVRVGVKKRLTLSERSGMVQNIVKMVFRGTDGEEVYAPYLRKIAYDYNILHYFTNVSLPLDVNKICEFIDNTDFVQTVVDAVGCDYVNDILRDANDLIEYNKDKLARRTKTDDFMDILVEFLKTMSNRTSDDKIGKMLSDAVSKVVGDAVETGEISEILEAMRGGGESVE